MEQRLSMITLGVADLHRSIAFYCDTVGWSRVPAAPGEDGIAFFDLGGIVFALYPHTEFAKDTLAELPAEPGKGYSGVALAHNVRSRDEVDAIFARLAKYHTNIIKPPEEAFWGGYSGYFSDPDGHCWEVAHNPFWQISDDGRVVMTPP